jgi:ABC-2 type transport system permease protein
LLVKYVPWVDAERFGPIVWAAHGKSIVLFALPNTFFIAAIIFSIGVLIRSTAISFMGGLVLLVADLVAEALKTDLQRKTLS